MKTNTIYTCEKCGTYEDKIIPIKEQKTLCKTTTTETGLHITLTHKSCGGKVSITDNGIIREIDIIH